MYWSPEHFRICGLDPETAKAFYPDSIQVIHPEDRSFVQQTLDEAVRQKSDFETDCRILCPDGTIRYIHSLAHPNFDASREFTGFVGTIIDTTERRNAEEKLAASERRLRLLLESIPHHVWSFHTDGTLAYWNRRLADYTGLTNAELHQGGWAALHPGDVERVRDAWQKAWSQGTMFDEEERVRGRDGRYRRFMCRAVPVPGEAGELVEWFGTNTDVEDRRQSQDALREKQAELEHAVRVTTMGELAASIAHDVNQPLGAIVTYGNACLRWLSAEQPNLDEVRSVVTHIVDEGHRAAAILATIRSLIQRSPPQVSALNMNELITDLLTFARPEILRNNISLRTTLASGLPPLTGDPIRLQQVILNLILNAIEAISANREGPRELLVGACQTLGNVIVSVCDSGVGIDAANAEKLFKPFFTSKPAGMGMGLAIGRSIIEEHGGRLWATQNQDHGATFRFSIPIRIDADFP